MVNQNEERYLKKTSTFLKKILLFCSVSLFIFGRLLYVSALESYLLNKFDCFIANVHGSDKKLSSLVRLIASRAHLNSFLGKSTLCAEEKTHTDTPN
jgi:hypothetical protein